MSLKTGLALMFGDTVTLADGTQVTIASGPLTQADAPGEPDYEVNGPAGRTLVNVRDIMDIKRIGGLH